MGDRAPAYADPELLRRVEQGARDGDLGRYREGFVRMVPRFEFATLGVALLAVLTVTLTVGFGSELFTRGDQMGGKVGSGIGLIIALPFAALFVFAFCAAIYRGFIGPATSRAVRLDLYERGLIFTDGGTARCVRYDTTVIHQEVVRHLLYGVVETRTTYDFTMVDIDGKDVQLQDHTKGGPPNGARWGAIVQDAVTAAQFPDLADRVYRGKTVTFGALWVSRLEFGAGSKSVRWSDISQISVQSGVLRVDTHGRWLALTNTPLRKIPNFYVLMALAHQLVENRLQPSHRPAARRESASQPPAPAPDDFRALLTMVAGSTATAERLIAYEREKLPGADRATWVTKALERLRRDRERHG
ncbi:DUF6585 family protein [Nocardia sp. NPDC057668]|uniref:DUF6585 family protein n=1 Tax=Nocardia sp. NPDC057668 TaxID=3346202 RepID=UPI00366F8D27